MRRAAEDGTGGASNEDIEGFYPSRRPAARAAADKVD
jgi:hypothetical protein